MHWLSDHTGLVGWLCIGVFVAIFDPVVIMKGKQSLTGAIQIGRARPTSGPAVYGFWIGLSYHLLIEKPRFRT